MTMGRVIGRVLLVAFVLTQAASLAMAQTEAPIDELRLPALFSDNMVLQRDKPIPVWGWAPPGAEVTVTIAEQSATAKANDEGRWQVALEPMQAGGPYELRVTTGAERTFSNVMLGDVWVGSGQSNMQWPVLNGPARVNNAEEEVANANYSNIRLFKTPMATAFEPLDQITGEAQWQVTTPETLPEFSAVLYFFGRELHQHLDVPVGLIQTAWGGTIVEAWASEEALRNVPDIVPALDLIESEGPNAAENQKAYEGSLAQWEASLPEKDKGMSGGEPAWAAPDLALEGWTPIDAPGAWEEKGHPGLDGVVWMRKDVELPEAWAGQAVTLELGAINDQDITYFNGVEVGRNPSDWREGRKYAVAGEHVKAGKNVIAVRVRDIGNTGGFFGKPEEMRLVLNDSEALPLAGEWQLNVGLDLKTSPPPVRPKIASNNPNIPTVLYNAMIHPLIPYAIKGAIWYQGESNAGRAYQYRTLFPTMIADWRAQWNQGDFPFFFVQLANFTARLPEPADSDWAELREAQSMTLEMPNTGQAVIIDIGQADDIHPQNKQDVGKRLALAARKVAYGEDLVYSGPTYKSMTIENGAVRLEFDNVGGGLEAKDGVLKGFSIAGDDKQFVWADARIDGNAIVVSSASVSAPVAVRYAWANNPEATLYNKEGLPASPFRTDDWPGITVDKKKTPVLD